MSHTSSKITRSRTAAVAITLAAFAGGWASSGTSAALPEPVSPWLESRNTDHGVLTSSLAGTTSSPRQDLRLPDSRDMAAGRGTFNARHVTVVTVTRPAPSRDGGINWWDAGVGAGGMLGLALLALGTTFAVVHRRQGASGRRQTATTG